LKKISIDLSKINKYNAIKPSISPWLNIAAIHSTMLALIIAIISAYIFLSFINLKEIESSVLEEAEKINDVHFTSSIYRPQKDEFKSIENFNVLWDLSATYLWQLGDSVIPHGPIKLDSGTYEIPEDLSDRAEKFFRLLYYLTDRYPFPHENDVKTVNNRSPWAWTPKSMHFEDIKEVETWLSDLNDNLYSFQVTLNKIILFPDRLSKSFDKLYEKNKDLINKKHLIGKVEANPKELIRNFFENNYKAQNIYIMTYHQLQRYYKYKDNILSLHSSVIIFIFGILSFFAGVLWPIFNIKYNYFVSNIIPTTFYVVVLIVVGYKAYQFF